MSSAHTLTDKEFALILGMIAQRPRLSNQQILVYFSRPGRDINHRVIGEIRAGWIRPGVAAAGPADVDLHMAVVEGLWRLGPTLLRHAWTASRRSLHLDWWPVGQGLFASGAIAGGPGPPLNWVYDCGTSSGDGLLLAALEAFEDQQSSIGAADIRLCVLSHFDKDHISGFVRLIDRFPVQTLLLPYIPLWRRLLIAIEQDIGVDDDRFDFFVDPVAWLTARGDGRIGEIIFVPATGPDDLPPAPEGPATPEEGGGDTEDRELNLKAECDDRPPPEAEGDPALAQTARGIRVSFLQRGGRLIAPAFWEFVPYNDASLAPKASRLFRRDADPLIAKLSNKQSDRDKALQDLKAVYGRHFGTASEARNLISLFLYSGPLGTRMRLGFGPGSGLLADAVDFAQMHTGDGNLNGPGRYDPFARFFGPALRLRRAKVFQVMHHGAEGSWHAGLAAKITPEVSIFCSNPLDRRYLHPHADVLRDFWPYGARQVDGVRAFSLHRPLIF